MGMIYRLVIINDGSTDTTQQTCSQLQQTLPDKIHIIDKAKNAGYAQAQKSGFAYALDQKADIVVLLHADGQYPPEEMARLWQPLINQEADMILASRMVHKLSALKGRMPLYKWLANIFLSTIENIAYGLKFSEYHSGYMLYNRHALTTIPWQTLSDTFHFDGEMLFVGAKKGLRVKELAIPTHYGEEKSHLKPLSYGLDVLRIIWKYKTGGYGI
jgi:glycosyltransferase involved in cell wall biosynthesis